MELGIIGAFIVGVIAIYFIAKIITLPAKIAIKLIYNGVIGGLMLWAVNLAGSMIGFEIGINVVSALIAGFLGVPGVIILIIWKLIS
jgi:inhibitor of the pro-sigma K processing machinery